MYHLIVVVYFIQSVEFSTIAVCLDEKCIVTVNSIPAVIVNFLWTVFINAILSYIPNIRTYKKAMERRFGIHIGTTFENWRVRYRNEPINGGSLTWHNRLPWVDALQDALE